MKKFSSGFSCPTQHEIQSFVPSLQKYPIASFKFTFFYILKIPAMVNWTFFLLFDNFYHTQKNISSRVFKATAIDEIRLTTDETTVACRTLWLRRQYNSSQDMRKIGRLRVNERKLREEMWKLSVWEEKISCHPAQSFPARSAKGNSIIVRWF